MKLIVGRGTAHPEIITTMNTETSRVEIENESIIYKVKWFFIHLHRKIRKLFIKAPSTPDSFKTDWEVLARNEEGVISGGYKFYGAHVKSISNNGEAIIGYEKVEKL